jgi:hypothetical protein
MLARSLFAVMPLPLVKIVDDAVDSPLFERLVKAVRALGAERRRVSYQTTFWYPLRSEPTALVELALLQLTQHCLQPGVTGVEWWLSRMKTSSVAIDFHQDRDNAAFNRNGRIRHPTVSSVLYLNRCVGGQLVVTKDAPNPKNPALAPSRHDFDVVSPAPNRFTWFAGHLTHGVLDARGAIPGARCPPQRTWRLAIALNWWKRQPEQVPLFVDSGAYRRLSLERDKP